MNVQIAGNGGFGYLNARAEEGSQRKLEEKLLDIAERRLLPMRMPDESIVAPALVYFETLKYLAQIHGVKLPKVVGVPQQTSLFLRKEASNALCSATSSIVEKDHPGLDDFTGCLNALNEYVSLHGVNFGSKLRMQKMVA